MPGRSGVTVVTTLVCLFFTHETAGALSARHSLRPLLGERFMHNSGASRREVADAYLKLERRHCEEQSDANRHCERSEAIHFAAQRKNGLLRRFAPRNDGIRIWLFENRIYLHRPGQASAASAIRDP